MLSDKTIDLIRNSFEQHGWTSEKVVYTRSSCYMSKKFISCDLSFNIPQHSTDLYFFVKTPSDTKTFKTELIGEEWESQTEKTIDAYIQAKIIFPIFYQYVEYKESIVSQMNSILANIDGSLAYKKGN